MKTKQKILFSWLKIKIQYNLHGENIRAAIRESFGQTGDEDFKIAL